MGDVSVNRNRLDRLLTDSAGTYGAPTSRLSRNSRARIATVDYLCIHRTPILNGRAHPRTQHQAFTDFINFYVVATTEKSDIVPIYHSNPRDPLSRLPRFMRGPPPFPPAGRTGSGLPVRAPRRYTPLTPALRGFLST